MITTKRPHNKRTRGRGLKGQKHKTFKKLNCSPGKGALPESCYNSNQLIKIRNKWNKRHPDKLITSNDGRVIWNKLKERMQYSCQNEKCWLKKLFEQGNLDKDLLTYTFSPTKPPVWHSNPNEWLSSDEIEAVMLQYENEYKDFQFIGPSPIDFDSIDKEDGDCVWPELCRINIRQLLNNNKTKIGISLNLDPHNKPGSHWVTLFVNLEKGYIVYFDSNGDPPPQKVRALMKKIKNQYNEIKKNTSNKKKELMNEAINKIEHQHKNTECGMYSLHFMIELIKNKDYNTFLKKRIPDEDIFKLRNKYFN